MVQLQRFKYRILWAYLLFFLLFAPAVAIGTETNKETLGKGPEHSSTELLQAINNSILMETGALEELKKRLGRLDIIQKGVYIEINAYNIQNSAHSNLLLQPTTPVTHLEKAFYENRLTLDITGDKIKDFTKRRDTVQELRQQTQDQILLSAKQSTEIKGSRWSKSENSSLLAALRKLDQILAEKQKMLQNLLEGLDPTIKQFETVRDSTSLLNAKFEQQIKTRKARDLLRRKYTLLSVFKKDAVAKEFAVLTANLGKPFQKDFLRGEGRKIRETATMSLLMLVFLAAIAVALAVRLRWYCLNYEKRPLVTAHRWRSLCVTLVRRSLFLLGIIIVLFSYDIMQFPHYRFPLHRPVLNLLLIFVFSRWLLDFLKYWQPGENLIFIQGLMPRIRRMTLALRYLAVVYIVIQWAVGEDSVILCVERLLIEMFLIARCVTFWRTFRNTSQTVFQDRQAPRPISNTTLMIFTYLITFGSLVIELAGYPSMALYWLVSWARSLAALFWAVILFRVIMEWRSDCYAPTVREKTEPALPEYPTQRLFITVCWLLWFCGFIVALILAWSTKQNVFAVIYASLNISFSIGNINASPLGLLFAVVIFFLTLVLTRLGRYILTEKIFVESDLETGLQDSITTISVYVTWGFGVILALSVMGVSTTSLTVVFGALGVGLGFGLQGIFNNFISGIILLFERPIQVGDTVEIGGNWGEVKKINVRGTVVQTFDNASLIIPNSEFISSQVTNWSFKESNLRRKLDVGVAYGSDVELVKETLIEIADQTKNVHKKPKPDVIFYDHGDSALIFKLRYWTTVSHYYTTWSDIRFSIDRLFRERNIEIAFPQRDIHIRSGLKDETPDDDFEKNK